MTEPRRSIWIVDDSRLERELATRALSDTYEVTTFTDGIDMLERVSSGALPDVIVLDWQMPGMSGLEVCRFLRSTARTAALPIVLLTVHQEKADIVEGLQTGADDFVSKPFHPAELVARVQALVRLKEMRERLEHVEAELRAALTHLPDAMFRVDRSGRVTFANAGAEQLLDLPEGSVVGSQIEVLLPELPLDCAKLADSPANDGAEAIEPPSFPDIVVDGRTLAPAIRRMPSDGAIVVTLRDVTVARREQARRLDFYSMAAHDLRSPLSSILLRTERILRGHRGAISPEVTEDLTQLRTRVRELVAMINDFLDLARLEGTSLRMDLAEIDLGKIAADAVREGQVSAESKKQELHLRRPEGPILVRGDARRLAQVFDNLLANALKFTGEGRAIELAIEVTPTAVISSVRDEGHGISKDALKTLFQRFSRGTHEMAGTGLGLMIVREIIDGHGGKVGVDSELGRGSRFWFELPRNAV